MATMILQKKKKKIGLMNPPIPGISKPTQVFSIILANYTSGYSWGKAMQDLGEVTKAKRTNGKR